MPQPNPISMELLEELNALPQGVQANPRDWAVMRLRKRIDQLKRIDPLAHYDLLGGLGAVTWDVEQMRSSHEAAVRIAPNESRAHDNYACSLFRMGFFAEAADRALVAVKLAPDNSGMTKRAAEISLIAGRIRRASAQWSRAVELQPDIDSPAVGILRETLHAAELAGIADDSAETAIELATDVFHRHGYYSVGATVTVLESDELPVISYSLTMPAVSTIPGLNVELAHALAESTLSGGVSTNLVIRFTTPASADDHLPSRVA